MTCMMDAAFPLPFAYTFRPLCIESVGTLPYGAGRQPMLVTDASPSSVLVLSVPHLAMQICPAALSL